jgi:hypothetical protein
MEMRLGTGGGTLGRRITVLSESMVAGFLAVGIRVDIPAVTTKLEQAV